MNVTIELSFSQYKHKDKVNPHHAIFACFLNWDKIFGFYVATPSQTIHTKN